LLRPLILLLLSICFVGVCHGVPTLQRLPVNFVGVQHRFAREFPM
jgi:hypothetical protein